MANNGWHLWGEYGGGGGSFFWDWIWVVAAVWVYWILWRGSE